MLEKVRFSSPTKNERETIEGKVTRSDAVKKILNNYFNYINYS